jgi:hypothetical protein
MGLALGATRMFSLQCFLGGLFVYSCSRETRGSAVECGVLGSFFFGFR